jgi:hypothetical protein
VASADTKEPSVITRAMNRPLKDKLLEKSIKLEQAEHAVMLADRAAGLAEFRRTETDYHKQQERAVKGLVDKAFKGGGESKPEGEAVPDDDETVTTTVDLGDRYTEEHHHHTHNHPKPDTVTNTTTTTTDKTEVVGAAPASGASAPATGATGATGATSATGATNGAAAPATNGKPSGSLAGTAAPWIAAAMAGPLGGALVGWYMASGKPDQPAVVQPSTVNVQDVQSAMQVEVFDEDGNSLEYIYTPQRPKPSTPTHAPKP